MKSLKQKTVTGIFWSSVERFSVQGVQFLMQVFMARLLSPEDYGVIGMLAIFLAIGQSFIDSGFSNALIQKKSRTSIDYVTVFWFNIVVGLFFYALLFWTSPYIADFYNTPILSSVTKIIALNLLFNSLTVVQRAKLTVDVDFKTQAKASFIAIFISGGIGITMAYYSYGVWALVWQTVIYGGINMLLLWIFSRWMPTMNFSMSSFKEMFSFGSKLLLSGLLDTIYRNIYTIVIGKKFAAIELGYYTRADQFAQFPSSNITGIVQRVTFPILSTIQDDDERLRDVYRRYLRMSAFIIFPLMTGLAAVASPFVDFVLTEKWDSMIILLQILCISYMWYPVHAINLNLLQVKGRSDLFLQLEIIKKVITTIILIATIPLGVKMMCVGTIVSSILCLTVNTYYTGKLIQVGLWIQVKDLFPILLYSFLMGGCVYMLIPYIESDVFKLLFGILFGICFYLCLNYFVRSRELKELFSLLKR